ncbi:MAG: hypothetical protein WCD89_23230 [Anaerocolumna sp.]
MEDINKVFGNGKTDIIVLYSGGKDSTYSLIKLKESGLFNMHALTFDNGFIKEEAKENIKKFTSGLKITHHFFVPDQELFYKALSICYKNFANDDEYLPYFKRNGVFCWPCFSFLYDSAYEYASFHHINYIFGGWNPGQIAVGKHSTLYAGQIPFHEVYSVYVRTFMKFLNSNAMNLDCFTKNIEPEMQIVPYFCFEKYDRRRILDFIKEKGWSEPGRCESCTSNCNLNTPDRILYRKQFGYDRYELQIQKMIENGCAAAGEKELVHREVLDQDMADIILQRIMEYI